jgi:CheY-like chemotaxis protein
MWDARRGRPLLPLNALPEVQFRLRHEPPDLILLDFMMPVMNSAVAGASGGFPYPVRAGSA